MKRRILIYRKDIDSLLESDGQSDWKYIKQEHLTQLAFFQHERLSAPDSYCYICGT